jgi:glutaredoxin
MLKLYQVEWCPECHVVRQALTELGLAFECVNVPADRDEREQLVDASGQDDVPMLFDGETAVVGADEIVAHLRERYPAPPDSSEHASRGRFRLVSRLDVPPQEVLQRVRAAFEREGFTVVAEVSGEALAPGLLPDGYTLVHVAVPSTCARVVRADPTIASAVTIPIAVYGTETGCEVAATKPAAGAWLYGVPDALSANRALTERVTKAVKEL